jgi:hypothetical protein
MIKELSQEYEDGLSREQMGMRNRISEINEISNRFANIMKIELQVIGHRFRNRRSRRGR